MAYWNNGQVSVKGIHYKPPAATLFDLFGAGRRALISLVPCPVQNFRANPAELTKPGKRSGAVFYLGKRGMQRGHEHTGELGHRAERHGSNTARGVEQRE